MRSELDGVEDITLDIKVPDVMSGKSELNNALYLKNLANNKIGSQSFEKIKSSPIKTEKRNKTRE